MTQEVKFCRNLIDRFCAPRQTLPASVWSEQNLVFNEPKIKGPFSTRGREYIVEWVDAGGPLPPNLKGGTDFILVGGTGVAKTIAMMARLCYRIANDPMRALIVKPTSQGPAGAKSFSKTRLQKAIKATECLRTKIPTGAFRYDFSAAQMQINGSVLDLTGSNSVGQLAENRCDVVEQDETDKYPPQTEDSKEANPLVLADERTKSVEGARRFKQSTPTLDTGAIWQEFKKTDQRRYFVPCPYCGKQVVFAWSKRFSVFEAQGFEAYIKWDDAARNSDGQWDLEKVVKSAHAVCPWCQGKILDSHKHEMNRHGEWRATKQGVPGYIGWHLPSMYSTSRDCDFGAMAKKFLTAKRSIDGVKGFINSDLAEPDMNQAVTVDRSGKVLEHIELTKEWIKILSVDHQEKAPYFWYVVRAWNGTDATHGIEYGAVMQWHELDELQAKHKILPIAVVIDARHNTADVKQNCANFQIATRGQILPAVQDALPMWCGWMPCMAFGNRKEFRVQEMKDGGIRYDKCRLQSGHDPFAGTDMAGSLQMEILEFKSDLFEDALENIRTGKTFMNWTISKEMDVEEYHRQISGKILKPDKKNPRILRWVQRRMDWPDHVRSCELMNLVHAYSMKLISYESIQPKEGT